MNTAVEALTVRDIATTDVVTLSPEMGLREAIELFDQRHISGAPIVSGRLVVGVLSLMEVLAFEAATPGVPAAREDAQTEDDRLSKAAAAARAEGARRIEPARGDDWDTEGPPSSYFTEFWEDVGADVVERISATEDPEWDFLGEHAVSEAMTLGVLGVQAEASLSETAAYMLDHSIHRVLVLDGQQLVGIVTTTDFLRAIAGRVG